jgi:hypothetical protein
MSETVGETIKSLVMAQNYLSVRMTISDEFIEFVKDNMPRDYEYFEEKEKAYQILLEALSNNK